MSYSAREIQERLFDLGYIDRGNSPTLPFRIYEWCRESRVTAPELDSALGWQQGTMTRWAIAHGLPALTGEDPGETPEPPPVGWHPGSGIVGTAAKPAPAADPYGPNDPLDPTPPPDWRADLRDWVDRTKFRLPGDEIAFFWEAKRRGLTHAQVEECLGAVPGSIDAECRTRGLM